MSAHTELRVRAQSAWAFTRTALLTDHWVNNWRITEARASSSAHKNQRKNKMRVHLEHTPSSCGSCGTCAAVAEESYTNRTEHIYWAWIHVATRSPPRWLLCLFGAGVFYVEFFYRVATTAMVIMFLDEKRWLCALVHTTISFVWSYVVLWVVLDTSPLHDVVLEQLFIYPSDTRRPHTEIRTPDSRVYTFGFLNE